MVGTFHRGKLAADDSLSLCCLSFLSLYIGYSVHKGTVFVTQTYWAELNHIHIELSLIKVKETGVQPPYTNTDWGRNWCEAYHIILKQLIVLYFIVDICIWPWRADNKLYSSIPDNTFRQITITYTCVRFYLY